MRIFVDDSGYVISYATVGDVDGSVPGDFDVPLHFEERHKAYRLEEGELIFDRIRWELLQLEKRGEEIRIRREAECFSVINRGKLWYDTLTLPQVDELNKWYLAWLDAPQTGVAPTMPLFLEGGGIEMCKLK